MAMQYATRISHNYVRLLVIFTFEEVYILSTPPESHASDIIFEVGKRLIDVTGYVHVQSYRLCTCTVMYFIEICLFELYA